MAKTKKLDLYKEHKAEYVTPKAPVLVEVAPATYLTIEGQGPPGTEAFQAKVGALYSVAFTIKMTRKFAGKGDYKVCNLEGLWWVAGKKGTRFVKAPPETWRWKLMIRVPEFITEHDLEDAKQALLAKKKPPQFTEVELESLEEGCCVQVLHVGPYADEGPTITAMHDFAKENGLSFDGLHHEIYLSDPRRVPPERLRTILRHPVRAS
ncbi:MAG: hypothetical protein AMK75_05700 [Planctomycetes bacterium SM23_65]|nr:MAG: hypothetical protein AMK75_05700 [Planctomycetes bacterium SM23_65]